MPRHLRCRGFFGHFQKQLADDMDIPVAVSSLVQVPWIRTMLKSNQKIGVLTANAVALNDHIFNSCGIYDTSDLVVADLRHGKDFSAIMEDRGTFDMAGIRQEVIDAAKKLVQDNPSIGAILLECSDMPPYASAIQAARGASCLRLHHADQLSAECSHAASIRRLDLNPKSTLKTLCTRVQSVHSVFSFKKGRRTIRATAFLCYMIHLMEDHAITEGLSKRHP